MYEWHHHHMIAELRSRGHDVSYCNPVETLGRWGTSAEMSQIALDAFTRYSGEDGCDLFFATATDETLLPGAVSAIRRVGVPTVNLSTDDLSVPFRVRDVSRSFDLVWTTELEGQRNLRRHGIKSVVLPWAANPDVFAPVEGEEVRAIGFVGSVYGARQKRIKALAEAGLPVRVYGKVAATDRSGLTTGPLGRAVRGGIAAARLVWRSLAFPTGRACVAGALRRSLRELVSSAAVKRSGIHTCESGGQINLQEAPTFAKAGAVYSRLGVSLGSLELASTFVLRQPVLFVRLREFEVPMAGGLHLANRHPELEACFADGKEMLFYDSEEELIDKARFYVSAAANRERARIKVAARMRAEAEHTWTHRFSALAAELGVRMEI